MYLFVETVHFRRIKKRRSNSFIANTMFNKSLVKNSSSAWICYIIRNF